MMKPTIELELSPFMVPNFVRTVTCDASENGTAIPLERLDSLTLDALCRQFRQSVFEKAKKAPPPEVRAAVFCDECREKL